MAEKVTLEIADLRVAVEGKEILKGLNLAIQGGEVHALMGPNGSGKTTLAFSLAGHPKYEVIGGSVKLNQQDLLEMAPNERAKTGLFLCFQYPSEIPGVSVANFLRSAVNAVRDEEISVWDFQELLSEKMQLLDMDDEFAARYLNEGFSGGEKKRNEMLQMLCLNPAFAILDETDSGLDIDALQVVSRAVNSMRGEGFGALVITHYNRILQHIKPDVVHVMLGGRIVRSGGPELADQIEAHGYDWLRQELGLEEEAALAQAEGQ